MFRLLLLLLLTRRINALLSGGACERTCQQPTHHKCISCNMKKAFRFVALLHCCIPHSSTNKVQLQPSLAPVSCLCFITRDSRATDQCHSTSCTFSTHWELCFCRIWHATRIWSSVVRPLTIARYDSGQQTAGNFGVVWYSRTWQIN